MTKNTVIGISGISGAGKSTLTQALSSALHAPSLYWDDFDDLSTSPSDYVAWFERGGDYEEFDYPHLADVLHTLKLGGLADHPASKKKIEPSEYIIVDAPLGKAHQQTAQYIDFFIHIDIPLDIALARRFIRDAQSTELSKEDIIEELECYLKQSRPLFSEEGMCAISNSADYIVDGTQTISEQVTNILDFLGKRNTLECQNINIDVVDKIDDKIEKKMREGFVEYEAKNGVDVNYKQFSLIMSNKDNVVGVLNAYTAYSEIYVDDIWVDKAFRGKGLGKKLLSELENRFKGKGFNNINLVTSAFQAPEFYKKCGFKAEFKRFNEKNPKFTKTFFVKYFGEEIQMQGMIKS